MRMCQAFGRAGHEVILIGQDCPIHGEPNVGDIFEFYDVERVFEVKRIKRLNVKGWGLLYGLQAARLARRLAPDLVYARNLWGAAQATRMGLPVVFEAHTLRFLSGRAHRLVSIGMLRRKTFRRLVVISGVLKEDVGQVLQERGLDAVVDLQVAHDGADLLQSDLQAAVFPGTSSGRLQVGYCGSLYSGKGAEIVPELARRCSWADFHIAGGSEVALQEFRSRTDLPENLTLHGFLPSRQAAEFCLGCDVLLAPNQRRVQLGGPGTDIGRWTSPLKIFEYMACAKPILCSDLPVLREILRDGETGWLLPPEDTAAWADALQRLRHDSAERLSLGQKALDDLKSNFTWQNRAYSVLRGLKVGYR